MFKARGCHPRLACGIVPQYSHSSSFALWRPLLLYAGPPETGEAGTVRIVCNMMADTFGFPHRGLCLVLGW